MRYAFSWIDWSTRRMEWPAHTLNLTPCNFGLWGLLKDRIFARALQTIPQLQEFITEDFGILDNDHEYLVQLLK